MYPGKRFCQALSATNHNVGLAWAIKNLVLTQDFIAMVLFPCLAKKPERSAAQGCGIRKIPQACPVDCYAL